LAGKTKRRAESPPLLFLRESTSSGSKLTVFSQIFGKIA